MTPMVLLAHAAIALVIAAIVVVGVGRTHVQSLLPTMLSALAAASAALLIVLLINHIPYVYHLDIMEGVVQQHARRALHGKTIYPVPTPEYVPLAYNALYYILAVPFLRLFGDTLPALRVVSVVGYLGAAGATFLLVRRETRSTWWATIATGLFFAAYAAMDAYLDTAHSDSWLLCAALWGTYLVARESRASRFAGVAVLVAAFWFKQHGIIFLGAALVYLSMREGWKSAGYWVLGVLGAPVLYVLMPPSVLGAAFHFFTWHVPSGWSQFTSHTIPRVMLFVAQYYPVLAVIALVAIVRAIRNRAVGLLDLMMGAAALTAIMGSLDPGASFNVFIPMGAFLIIYGCVDLARLDARVPLWHGVRPAMGALLLAFATLVYDPRPYLFQRSATESYAELRTTVNALPGPVYAPGIGQFSDGKPLYPAAHWVALDDIMRGPRRTTSDSSLARHLVDDARAATQPSFVLTNRPLDELAPPINELAPRYALDQDFGARFSALHTLPRRFDQGYPRYLYRSTGSGESTHGP